jgi:hypothetical protein
VITRYLAQMFDKGKNCFPFLLSQHIPQHIAEQPDILSKPCSVFRHLISALLVRKSALCQPCYTAQRMEVPIS